MPNGSSSAPRALWLVVGAAAGLRLLLLPLMHPWDGNTFHNLFAQLASGENPYATFWDLTLGARSRAGFAYAYWYEYYAYPPLLIYLYWPLAKLASLVVPLSTHFYIPGTVAAPNAFPLAFLALYKLPIWLADFAIGWMLWWRTRRVWAVALYLLNPLVVVVSGAWMFDAIPAALTLGALLLFERGRVAWCGALLALGFLAKFYPLFLLPVFFMALVWREDVRAFLLVGVFAAVSLLLCLPFVPEIGSAFVFNAGREGGGLTLHQLFQTWFRLHDASPVAFQLVLSPAAGSLLLVGGLGIAYALLDRYRPPLPRALLLALLTFLLVSKVVNEQYAVWVLPFAAVVLADMAAPSRAAFAAVHLLWAVPFAYLLVHVPATAFWPGGLAATDRILEHPVALSVAASVAALAFVATLGFALWTFRARPEGATA